MICAGGLVRATRFALVIEGEEYRQVTNQVTEFSPASIGKQPVTQPTPQRDVPWPGTKIEFGELSVRVLLNAGMANAIVVYEWLRGHKNDDEVHDLSLIGYDSGDAAVWQQRFTDAFPVAIDLPGFNTKDASDTPLDFGITFNFVDMVFV